MVDVAIIGAGIAGLTAGYALNRSGLSTRVFEARDRIGGRVFAEDLGGAPVEMGPTWVWESETAVMALLRELGIGCFAHHDQGIDLYEAESLQRGRLPRSAVPEFRVVGGTQALSTRLASGVGPIELQTPVLGLHPGVDGVEVRLPDETCQARWVLAAMPPSLVAQLCPDVPQARIWSQVPVWMGDVAKVVMRFDSRFWKELGLSGRAASARGPMVEIHDMSGADGEPALLFGFVPRAAAEEPLRARVLDQLQRLFGPRAVPRHLSIQRWWDEAHTVEADPAPSDHRLFGHPQLAEPAMGGRLHLISCETSAVSPGHLNGAVERALSVAKLIVEAQ